MLRFICFVIVIVIITCIVDVDSEVEVKVKFKVGDWDEYDSLDDGDVYEIRCDLNSVE